MTDLIFIILFVIFGFIITIITSFNDFFDNKRTGLKKITKNGAVFLIVAVCVLILYIFQYMRNEHKINESNLFYKNNLEENRKLIVDTFSKELAKHSLKYDSTTQTIKKIIKSSKGNLIINEAEPFLSLCKEYPIELHETSEEYYKFNLNICNSEAPSRNIKAEVFVVSINLNNKMKYCKYLNLFQSKAQLDKGAKVSQQILVPNAEKLQLCYFFIKGSWTNISESKKYYINNIFHYNFETKESGGITAAHEKQIRNFLKDKIN